MPDIDDLFSDPNGPAYEAEERRVGVPLSYVAEKLGSCLEAMHSAIVQSARVISPEGLRPEGEADAAGNAQHTALTYGLVAFLALYNMLGMAPDPLALSDRLSEYSTNEFRAWLDQVEQGGSLEG